MADQEFKRENRYLVLKRDDIARYLSEEQLISLDEICGVIEAWRASEGKTNHGYVVVSDDWPEYETVFQMIEARVTGQTKEML